MKTLKAICTAAILALALSVPAYAGDVQTPGCTAPPPTANSTEDMSTPYVAASWEISSPGFADMLSALILLF